MRLMDERENFFSRHGNGDLRLREMVPSRGLPPSSAKYRRERRDHSQKPNIDPNLLTQLLFLINQDPRDILQKLDELRDHLSRSCEISEKPRERPLPPVSRRALPNSSIGHHQNHASAFHEVHSPRNHFSPRHLHSLHRHNLHGEDGARSFNERYRRVRAPQDPYTQYSSRPRDQRSACSSSYGESHHRFEDNSYFAPTERSLFGSVDYDRRSKLNAPIYSRVETFKRRVKQSYLPMNGASPFAVCDSCFALLQLPSGFVFNSVKRNSQFKCGSCSAVIGLKFPKGKHQLSENHSVRSCRSLNYVRSSNYSRENVYSKDIKPVSLTTSRDFEEREHGYGSSDNDTPNKVMDGRDFREVSFGTYEATDVSVEEAGDVSENELLEDSRERHMGEDLAVDETKSCIEDVKNNRERHMGEDLAVDETKSCIEDVKKTVEIDQLADAAPPGENLSVCSGNEEIEMKAQRDSSIESVGVEVKDAYETSTEHAEENSVDTALNENIQNIEETERPVEDVSVEVEKISTDTVALKENNENKEMENSIGDSDEVDSVNSHSINSSSYRESSRGSFEVRMDEDQSLAGKNGDSFLGGLVKRSFKFNRSTDRSKCRVWVNGRPISERAVKRAEKKAGPIDPGDYWYDYRAGFWGVMGHQCLGIIPPFIKEFNYPMPQNCANGTTGVMVNGRELHQKDLALLVGRGLPSVSGRSYMIEMSGKVVDEATGRELRNLGKLAPTIEILKRGFGMLVPPDIN